MNLVLQAAIAGLWLRSKLDGNDLTGGTVMRLTIQFRRGEHLISRREFKVKNFTEGRRDTELKFYALYLIGREYVQFESGGRLSREKLTLIFRAIRFDGIPAFIGGHQANSVVLEYDFARRSGDRLGVVISA